MQLNRLWLQQAGNDYAIESIMKANLSAPSCVDQYGIFDNCSGEDVKNNDLYEWKDKFIGANVTSSSGNNTGLIDADACIEVTSTGVVTIILSWFSTVKSRDAAESLDHASLAYKCGEASSSRRQLVVDTYIGKSS